jgi:protein involved in temperature-dependent protein secretion
MSAFGAAAQAEAAVAQRYRDPGVAGRRAAFGPPPPYAMALVQAAVSHAQGDAAGARAAIAQAASMTPPISGTLTRHGGSTQRFTAFTDSDELTGATLIAYDGPNPLDLSLSELISISFAPPKTTFDVMWPQAEIVTVTGMTLRVRVPA